MPMMPGGGHRTANPHRGKKSPARGDRVREKKAGRKRVGKVYREKGPSHVTLREADDSLIFTGDENKLLYALNKRHLFGEDRADELIPFLRSRRVLPQDFETFIERFSRKLHHHKWGEIYTGGDNKTYIFLYLDKRNLITNHLKCVEP